MTRKYIITVLLCGLLGIAWGNYRWHQGFGTGADITLCLMSIQIDGSPYAMKQRYCLASKGKKPPYWPDRLRPEGPPLAQSPSGDNQ